MDPRLLPGYDWDHDAYAQDIHRQALACMDEDVAYSVERYGYARYNEGYGFILPSGTPLWFTFNGKHNSHGPMALCTMTRLHPGDMSYYDTVSEKANRAFMMGGGLARVIIEGVEGNIVQVYTMPTRQQISQVVAHFRNVVEGDHTAALGVEVIRAKPGAQHGFENKYAELRYEYVTVEGLTKWFTNALDIVCKLCGECCHERR